MSGTARPLDSGRRDALGRTVKVSGQDAQSRSDAPLPQSGPQFDDDTIAGIVARRNNGIDCTEDESAQILAYFDSHHPETTDDGEELARLFPAEADQWHEEVEIGVRPHQQQPTPPPPPAPRILRQIGVPTKYGTIGMSLTRTGPNSAEGYIHSEALTNRNRAMRIRTGSEPNIRITDGKVTIDRHCIEKQYTDRRWPSITSWTSTYGEATVDKMVADFEDEIAKMTGQPDWNETVDALSRGRARAAADSRMEWEVRSRMSAVTRAREELAKEVAEYEATMQSLRDDLAASGLDEATIDSMVADAEQKASDYLNGR